MDLNDLVLPPNNKAKFIRLNARNMKGRQKEAVTLDQESKDMEEKLQQLKASMIKEKEERRISGGFKWKYGQSGSLHNKAPANNAKKDKENRLQKLSEGRVTIQMLKDEPLTALPPLPPAIGPQTTKKQRSRGANCGPCEVKASGLTVVQTPTNTQDVVGPNPNPNPSHIPVSSAGTRGGEQKPEKGREAVAKPTQLHPGTIQILAIEAKYPEIGLEREGEKEFPISLLSGEYNEEESARSFQEAVRMWRGEARDGAVDLLGAKATWRPVRRVSSTATQAELRPDGEAEGRGRVPVRVEFSQNNLSYMERLLLKKHRRSPLESYEPLLALSPDLKYQPNTDTDEETDEEASLIAQREEFRRFCASLFGPAVPVGGAKKEAQATSNRQAELCLTIEVLGETDGDTNGDFAERRTNHNTKAPFAEQRSGAGGAPGPQAALTRLYRTPTQQKTARRPYQAKPQTSRAEQTTKTLPSKCVPSACPPAETPVTSQTSTAKSQKCSGHPTVHKPTADHGLPQLLPSQPHYPEEILKFSRSPLTFQSDVPPPAHASSPLPKEPRSPSAGRASSSSSSVSTLIPPSPPLHRGSDSSLLPKGPRSSSLFTEPISSPKRSQSTPSNLESPRHSRRSLCDLDSPLSDNPTRLTQSSPTKHLPVRRSVNTRSNVSLFIESDLKPRYKSEPTCGEVSYGDTPVFVASLTPGKRGPTLSRQDTQSVQSRLSHSSSVIQNPRSPVRMKEEEEELLLDSGDEMSGGDGSSDEEAAATRGRLTSGRSRREEQGSSATSHLGDSFAPTDDETESDEQTDEPQQLSVPAVMAHNWSAGSGSEQLYDPQGLFDLSLDSSSGYSDAPRNIGRDPMRTSQTSPRRPRESASFRPSSNLGTHTERHLVFKMIDNHMQPSGIEICSTTTASRGEISAKEPGTSVSSLPGRSTPNRSRTPRTTRSPRPVFPSPSSSASPLLSAFLSRRTLGSESRSPEICPPSRAASEITQICDLDQTGCEDPDLEMDTAAHILYSLEQELMLMAKESGMQDLLFGMLNSGGQDQRGNQQLRRVSEEETEREEAAQRDQQSVLLLP